MTQIRSSVAFSLHAKTMFKVIVVGESGAGKTSFILRYVKNLFDRKYLVSLGV